MKRFEPKIEIRPLELPDLPMILEIERISFVDPWSAEAFRSVIVNSVYLALGAFEDSLRGYLVAAKILDELHIYNIAVTPENRKQGIGNLLLKNAIEKYRAELKTLFLEVRVSNAEAIRFYEKREFKIVGKRKGYYRDGEDALLMTRYIG